jgi:nitroreductase
MNVYEAAVKRRAIRRFQNKPVPYDVLEKSVDASRLAPCGRNQQLGEYIIVNDEQMLSRVFDSITGWAGQPAAKSAPPPEKRPKAYVIILINKSLEAQLRANRRDIALYDVGMSAENLILVALEQGVGSCPILSFDQKKLKQALNIPDNYDAALVVAMGYPDESPVTEVAIDSVEYWVDSQGVRHVPKRKLADIRHHNKFS